MNESSTSDDSGNDWFVSQDNKPEEVPINSPKYGFANKVSGALAAFEVRFCNLFFDIIKL